MHAYMFAHALTHTGMHAHTLIHECTHLSTQCTHLFTRTLTHFFTHKHTCIHTPAHAHTRTQTLQSHYSPEVSGLVKRLLSPDLAVEKGRREEELGRYLHVEPERLFRQACTDLSKETSVPMNFVKPTGLWLPSNLEVT